MKRRFMIDPVLCAVSAVIAVIALVLGVTLVTLSRPWSALFFGAITATFGGIAAYYGASVTVDSCGVAKTLFGRTMWRRGWDEIREVGVCGTKIFRDPKSKRVGTLYIYFSEHKLDERSRFKMLVNWPPRKVCFMMFGYDRFRAVQTLWNSQIESFNTGDMHFGENFKA